MARSWIEIDKSSLLSNLASFRSLLAPGTALMTVVKSNAYGHGLEPVSRIVSDKTDWLGVDSLEEALALEKLGLSKPILILGYTPPEEVDEAVRAGFRTVVYREDVARAISTAAVNRGVTARVHLKIETGTHRQGVDLLELPAFTRALAQLPGVEVEGVYTHFANIEDTLDPSFAEEQRKSFARALAILAAEGIRPPVVHTAATAGVILYPETHFNLVRIGIGAYGIWPSRETQIAARERGRQLVLSPVLTWKSRVAQVKRIAPGDYVGYGLTFQAARPMTIAIVPVGYYDGYDRRLSGAGRALWGGRYVSVLGRVAMNMVAIDVTDTPTAAADDTVTLLGREGSLNVGAEEIAERIGTIPYEVLARIHRSLPRVVCG